MATVQAQVRHRVLRAFVRRGLLEQHAGDQRLLTRRVRIARQRDASGFEHDGNVAYRQRALDVVRPSAR